MELESIDTINETMSAQKGELSYDGTLLAINSKSGNKGLKVYKLNSSDNYQLIDEIDTGKFNYGQSNTYFR